MTDKPQTTPGEWTDEQSKEIQAVVAGLAKTLVHNDVDTAIATSALMILSATAAAASANTDEYIIEKFKGCLLDARTRGKDYLPNA